MNLLTITFGRLWWGRCLKRACSKIGCRHCNNFSLHFNIIGKKIWWIDRSYMNADDRECLWELCSALLLWNRDEPLKKWRNEGMTGKVDFSRNYHDVCIYFPIDETVTDDRGWLKCIKNWGSRSLHWPIEKDSHGCRIKLITRKTIRKPKLHHIQHTFPICHPPLIIFSHIWITYPSN